MMHEASQIVSNIYEKELKLHLKKVLGAKNPKSNHVLIVISGWCSEDDDKVEHWRMHKSCCSEISLDDYTVYALDYKSGSTK